MKKFFFLFFLLIFVSCSSKKTELEIDIDNLKKEGRVLIEKNISANEQHNISNIKNFDTYPLANNTYIFDWNYSHLNSSNYLNHFMAVPEIKILKKERIDYDNSKNNFFEKNILYHNKKIIYVDDFSNLLIVDNNFNLLKKYQIHPKSSFGKYSLKFSLASENGIMYIADNLGFVLAYDLNNFTLLWKINLNVPFFSNLVILNKDIFVTNSNGKLFSINKLTGKQNWSFETGTSSIKSYNAFKIAIYNDKLVFSNDLGVLYCINLSTQSIAWSINIPESIKKTSGEFLKLSPLVLRNNFLYVASNYGKFIKVNLNTGEIIWSVDAISYTIPILNPSSAIIVDENGYILIIDINNGKVLYKNKLDELLKIKNKNLKKINFNNMFLASNKLYITTIDGYLFYIDVKNLENIKYKKISESINSNILINDNNIFFLDTIGTIYKIK